MFQVKTVGPVQLTNLMKSFTLFFFVFTLLWAFSNLIAIGDVIITWPVLAINLTVGALFGWRFYKNRYHTLFSYDETGFQLRVGRNAISKSWKDFTTVSLFHMGYGEFNVRLYDREQNFLDIPVSTLGLDPQGFRFQVMEWVKGRGSS